MTNHSKKIYFASDFHLGIPSDSESLLREKKIVLWLDQIKIDASEIYLMGDLFDFWFEYKNVVPKGFVRLLGKLAELSDMGISIHVFTGNHDLWMFGYLQEQLNAQLYNKPVCKEIYGKYFYLAHGDGLGPGDNGFKFLKSIFTNKICQKLFAALHPYTGIKLANYFSKISRNSNNSDLDGKFLGQDKEWLILHSKKILKLQPEINFFIFGHRHYPIDIKLNENCRYINLGDWIQHFTYVVFDGKNLELKWFKDLKV